MHRSLILTEMMTSTFSNDKYQQVKDKNGKKQLLARFGIGVIEVGGVRYLFIFDKVGDESHKDNS